MTPDVNVLVAAARFDHQHHRVATAWIDGALNRAADGGSRLTLLPMVVAGYLRVVRVAHITPTPISAARALTFVEELMQRPNVGLASVGPEWAEFAARYRAREPVRGDVTDAWIAAAVLHLGEHLVTLDRDFLDLLPPAQLTVLDPAAS